ncbi:GNAT family N-acetyltransferase [Marinicaulis aureus]|uniref:GNAT family N-acetyltransferase n=1 Tax=Hyphococcus aureus TaxID=2666033 RepID=A0ABW1L037_9PROT
MVTLRPATKDDIPLLRRWDEKPHVKAAGGDDDWYEWDDELPRNADWGELLIAEEAGRPVGVMEIIDPAKEPSHYWGEIEDNLRAIDIWIGEEEDLGRGLGTQMMLAALGRCFADEKVRAVVIDPLESNIRARRFYERLGFEFVERRVFDQDECIVYRLTRAGYEALAACP